MTCGARFGREAAMQEAESRRVFNCLVQRQMALNRGPPQYLSKRYAVGQRAAVRSSLDDWKGRGHFSRADNTRSKVVLGGKHEGARELLVSRGIVNANLIGL